VCAVAVVVLVLPFVLLRRDVVIDRASVPPWRWRRFLGGFWISPRVHPDFAWAWLTRLLMNLGYAVAIVYLLYFLRDELDRPHAESDVFLLTVINTVGVATAVLVAGVWSDRLGRRRVFVIAAGVVLGLGALVVALSPTWTTLLVASFFLGVGFGVYTSVDFALITQVLPDDAARGKDLGVLNIASALPQVLAPAIAAPVVTLAGYPTLFAVAGFLALLGGVLVRNIRSVA
jgi:MFS family permease